MKTIFTILMSISFLAITLSSQGKGTPQIVQEEESTSTESVNIQNLLDFGFTTMDKKSIKEKNIKKEKQISLKSQNKNEKASNCSSSSSPDFSKLIFNFI